MDYNYSKNLSQMKYVETLKWAISAEVPTFIDINEVPAIFQMFKCLSESYIHRRSTVFDLLLTPVIEHNHTSHCWGFKNLLLILITIVPMHKR